VIGGWKRQEEVRVDGDLRVFLLEKRERSLPDRVPRAARRCQLEADPGRPEIDPDDVGVEAPRRGFGAADVGDAAERVLDGVGRPQHGGPRREPENENRRALHWADCSACRASAASR